MTLRSTHLFFHRVRSIILCVVLLGILNLSLSSNAHASSTIPSAPIATGETSYYPPALSPSPDSSRLYMGWTGTDTHVNITFKNSSDASFPQQNKITLADTANSAPSMATFKNQLYVAYQGTDSGGIWGNLAGLGIYTGAQSLQQFSAINLRGGGNVLIFGDSPPAIVSTNGTLYVAWISSADPDHLVHIASSTSSQPSAPFTDYPITNPNANGIGSPIALTVSHGVIYVTYADFNNRIEQGTYSPGSSILSNFKVLDQQTFGYPATTANGTGVVWLAFPGTDGTTLCTTMSPNNQGCTSQATGNGPRNPALGSSFGGQVFLAWLEGISPPVINFCQLSTKSGGRCM